MRISEEKCIGCGSCISFCPVGCIVETNGKVSIERDECVDCGALRRADVCPTDAFYMPAECWFFAIWCR